VGSASLGTPGTLQNSQCIVDTGASTTSKSGNNLTVNLAISFKAGFTGTKNIYMSARDKTSQNSGWQNRGTWSVASQQAPLAVSVTPSSGSGISQTFQFTYSDPNGYADIALVQMVINSPLSYVGSCSTYYYQATNTILLIQDSGSGYVGSAGLGTPGTLQNSQCVVDTGASTTSKSGNNLTVNLAISFKAGFTGTKNIYMSARDKASQNSGWQNRGTWNIPSL
jgi:trimeric autotransporter adhesin